MRHPGIRVCKANRKSGASLASRAGVSETTKQKLLEQAADLVGYEDLANGLGVPEKTLKDWINGVSTMPDTKLRPLADLLTRIADSRHRTKHRFGMDDTAKQQLFQRAADLLGRDEIRQRLNVPSEVIEAWMRGDVSLPDGKLLVLACVLETFSRRISEW
jgi:transcriptional regulator with XRE-family HTH domain